MALEFCPDKPCGDCVDGRCTMNCSAPGRWVDMHGWRGAPSAPRTGDHILVCSGHFDRWTTFNQRPPVVVHYWANPGEEGFYLSAGIVEGSYNDEPVAFDWWKPLVGTEPMTE